MAKLTKDEISKELKVKGFTLHENSPDYTNLSGEILIRCENGHSIESSVKNFRQANFQCPTCVGESSKGFGKAPVKIPPKTGYRVIGVDNATQKMGISVFDDGKLVFYTLYQIEGQNVVKRLNKIRDFFENVLIPVWKPDYIQFEDIQFQNNYNTYEVLAKLIGVIEMAADRNNIQYHIEKVSVWRSHHGINSRDRVKDKVRAMRLVEEMYQIKVGDDVAEAILIGKYRVDMLTRVEVRKLF